MLDIKRIVWILFPSLASSVNKQVVSQLPFSSFCLYCLAVSCLLVSVQSRVASSYMPGKRHKKTFETLLQTKERLTRELRLKTEKRQRELLEPEQLAVKEDDSDFVDSDSEEPEQVNRHLTTTNSVLSVRNPSSVTNYTNSIYEQF